MKTKGKRCSQEEIIKRLQEVESSNGAASVARDEGVCVQTIYRCSNRTGGTTLSELVVLKSPQAGNARLKRIVVTQAMDSEALKEIKKGRL